ncbi:PTPA-CTERM sorting domain-containing protein [Leptolyngbya sp. FACHB-671]|uniref:PTPA-CTERM sorting domain-containing protein n=1 Tax=unclassified Leptolyngbya TaxID=2650499 RepID=UPI001686750E|nr:MULTISPECIES: PTPA-CTERM sorting domain-containing protein [unclassified Leptolyngbya]MBD2000323.1 PTPA-CTERM sorting domain-containing protein [Leptolyngbya sp. FACHB-541]MBD2068397.1 PTPA-CTERM sorting domain-containing protein [Leptolyngbya sp. FACHB-671]
MNFKSFALKTAIAATVLTGSTLAVSPAEALEFGSQLDFTGYAVVSPESLDFKLYNGAVDTLTGEDIGEFSVAVSGKTGSFTGLPSVNLPFLGAITVGQVKDISSVASFTAINNFLYFGENSPFNFNLTSFAYNSTKELYEFSGLFADNTIGTGRLTTQFMGNNQNSYSVTIVAGNEIPTPALLPGLIGMGAAVLRKRNAEENEQVEAEA